MAGLQRSAVSFRRQGSSGLVWDDKLISEELDQKGNDLNTRTPPPPTLPRTRSNSAYRTGKVSPAIDPPSPKLSACGCGSAYRTGKVSPAIDPPSPKLSACGCCTAFAKSPAKPLKHRTR
ncbi:uncharacterized protein At1g15400 [Cajanus cajan]|uniref:Uncharacterized protein At1g15400 family n=1 Tax=Cajanus cajan TaxID=3821 RepID=A0A151SH03_CAJCA|nr:uncharacterized protein At1g15400 [Cajanus cajan]KYP54025.1 Uncharacterized protein At1g15400 family [Cajanus cajan]